MNKSCKTKSIILVLGAVFLAAHGALSDANAMPVGPSDPYYVGDGPAAFRVVDNFGTDGDGMVTLDLVAEFSGLQYRYGANGWSDVPLTELAPDFFIGSLSIMTGGDHSEAVYFRTGGGDDTAAMFFYGFDDPLWNSIALDFDLNGTSDIVSATPGDGDHVAPIPLPAALWLFGSGLLGLLGIRRKVCR